MTARTILGVFAHPDDESMGPGGTLARYAAEGHRVAVLTATAGGAGRHFDARASDEAARRELERVRRLETLEACRILGVEHLGFLGWEDGGLRKRDVLDVEETIAALFRRERPDVVITFHASGISYHADHRVLSLALTGAFLGAGRRDWYAGGVAAEYEPHSVAKLYGYTVGSRAIPADWPRRVYRPADGEITTVLDTRRWQDARWAAIQAHTTQQFGPPFRTLYEAGAFAEESFVRVFPSPRPGEVAETDLLAGLR